MPHQENNTNVARGQSPQRETRPTANVPRGQSPARASGADPVGPSAVYPLKFKYRKGRTGYGKVAVTAAEVPDGKMWEAPQIGFTLEAKVEIQGHFQSQRRCGNQSLGIL